MLACFKYRKRLGAFLDKELSGREQGLLEQHLSRCASCRAVLEDLRRLAPLLVALSASPAPDSLTVRILAAARARQIQKSRGLPAHWWQEMWSIQPWAIRGATAAALVIGLTMGGYMGWSGFHNDRLAHSSAGEYGFEVGSGPLYAFQTLGAAPQGSMVAATLALAEIDMRGER